MSFKLRIQDVCQRVQDEFNDSSCKPIAVDDVLSLLYAIDPRTGVPDSSLGLVFSGKANSEVQEYVKDRLFLSPNAVYGVGGYNSADDALSNVVPFDFQYGTERLDVANFYMDKFRKMVKKDVND